MLLQKFVIFVSIVTFKVQVSSFSIENITNLFLTLLGFPLAISLRKFEGHLWREQKVYFQTSGLYTYHRLRVLHELLSAGW